MICTRHLRTIRYVIRLVRLMLIRWTIIRILLSTEIKLIRILNIRNLTWTRYVVRRIIRWTMSCILLSTGIKLMRILNIRNLTLTRYLVRCMQLKLICWNIDGTLFSMVKLKCICWWVVIDDWWFSMVFESPLLLLFNR